MSVIAYMDVDSRTRDLMDDIWASTELSPTVIEGLNDGSQLIEVADDVGRGVYLLDNGLGYLPNGQALRAQYVSRKGKVTEVFRVYGLDPNDRAEWQAKAVEALISVINKRQRRNQRNGFGELAASD
jgi:hypothetical protein